MALSFPRELYSYEMTESTFAFVEGVGRNRIDSGRLISAVERSDPYVRAKFRTRNLYLSERAPWAAWKLSLQGGLKRFIAYDVSRRLPFTYTTWPYITWDGTINVTSIAARSMVGTGAPSGFVILPGDAVGLVEGGRYWWGMASEAATAGGTITVSVEPWIPLNVFTTAATGVLYRPKAQFLLDHDTWEESGDLDFSPITFEASQVI